MGGGAVLYRPFSETGWSQTARANERTEDQGGMGRSRGKHATSAGEDWGVGLCGMGGLEEVLRRLSSVSRPVAVPRQRQGGGVIFLFPPLIFGLFQGSSWSYTETIVHKHGSNENF
jgi:hypothetical protein